MANQWFRLYSEFADDPKVQMLSEPLQRRLIMLFCSKCKGETLHETERAFHWRVSEKELAETKSIFIEKGFIDDRWNLLNWNKRQFLSDSSTDRVRRHRQLMKQDETLHNVSVTEKPLHVTAPEQNRTETEQTINPSMVVSGVLTELSLSGRELRCVLDEVVKAESLRSGYTPGGMRDTLVTAWTGYLVAVPKLKYKWSAAKFFGEGNWKSPENWPWLPGEGFVKPAKRENHALRLIEERAEAVRRERAL